MRNSLPLCGVVLTTLCLSCAARPPRILVIAHRGDSSNAPENTLSAFRSAIRAGADLVELDARQTADGTLVCLHDETLDRTTDAVQVFGRKKVLLREVRDAELTRLEAGMWFDPPVRGERIPTLAEALDCIQAGSRTLLEHKDGPAAAYARLLREKKLVGRLVVQSFNWDFLRDLHRLEPRQPLAALGEKVLDESRWTRLAATGARTVAWKHTDITPELIAEARRRRLAVWAWTVDEPKDWERLVEAGIDGIITNRPGPLRHWLQQRAGHSQSSAGGTRPASP